MRSHADQMVALIAAVRQVLADNGVDGASVESIALDTTGFNKPVLVPKTPLTSIGSGIFAQLEAGLFGSIAEAQRAMCLRHRTFLPEPEATARYQELHPVFRALYFALGEQGRDLPQILNVLGRLRTLAADARQAPQPNLELRT